MPCGLSGMFEKVMVRSCSAWTPILTGGSPLTFEYAAQAKKPGIHIHKSATDYSDEAFFKEVGRLKDFIESNQIILLNVVGPRESNQPGVYAFALKMLRQYWDNR
ncbi:MAG: putative molybdenum carrier protein [Chthoniobacterales bacterium]